MLAEGFKFAEATTYRFCVSLLHHLNILIPVMHVCACTDDACHI